MLYVEPSTPTVQRPAALQHITSGLQQLATRIDLACRQPTPAMHGHMVAALDAAVACPDLLAPGQCAARPDRYVRHVLYGDPAGRFTILALVWGRGQFSPPHGHHTWCAFAVHTGTLTETAYAFDGAAMTARPLRQAARHAGYCCFDPAESRHVHRLGNAAMKTAISIHVYGVSRERVQTDVNWLVEVAS
jgi:predicted metal-dependent enzyme (double-stranded beta helix superfamily)